MNLVQRKRYTAEFKAQAVELLSTGEPVSQVAEELCIIIDVLRQATGYGTRQICASLQVPRSSFYHAASPTATQSEDRSFGDLIEAHLPAPSPPLWLSAHRRGTLRRGRGHPAAVARMSVIFSERGGI